MLEKGDVSQTVYIAEGIIREECTNDTNKFVIELVGGSDSKWKCVDSCD